MLELHAKQHQLDHVGVHVGEGGGSSRRSRCSSCESDRLRFFQNNYFNLKYFSFTLYLLIDLVVSFCLSNFESMFREFSLVTAKDKREDVRQRCRNESIAEYYRDSMWETSLSEDSTTSSRSVRSTGETSDERPLMSKNGEKKNKKIKEFISNNLKVILSVTTGILIVIVISTYFTLSTSSETSLENRELQLHQSNEKRKTTTNNVSKYSQLESYSYVPESFQFKAEQSDDRTEILLIGGEDQHKRLSPDIVIYSSREKSCLPPLPRPVKWGVGGVVGGRLLVCGGEMYNQQPLDSCHLLSTSKEWQQYYPLHSHRSQSSYASTNDSRLLVFGGYNRKYSNMVIPSLESLALDGGEVQNVTLDSHVASRFSSAVTLSSGKIVITGGMARENLVTLVTVTGSVLETEGLAPLREGRYRHSSVSTFEERGEVVIVAGGKSSSQQMVASVEKLSLKDNKWTFLKPLPVPRIDFTLQVPFHPSLRLLP